MNNILHLKGRFDKRKNESGFGTTKLPAAQKVEVQHIENLINQLKNVKEYWLSRPEIGGLLVSVHYIRVVAKSNRLKCLLGDVGVKPTASIRGARFVTEQGPNGNVLHKHVFTHYIQMSAVDKAIDNLKLVRDIVKKEYKGTITAEDTELLNKGGTYKYSQVLKKSNFLNIVVDSFFVESFSVDLVEENPTDDTLVTIYATDMDTRKLLAGFGLDVYPSNIVGDTMILLKAEQAQLLYTKAPYLIAMSVTDFSKLYLEPSLPENNEDDEMLIIPHPQNEPIVGVIDTHFKETVYFHEWVDYRNMMSSGIELQEEDYLHGTAVTSIIVDGPKGNANLDDGCGRFRVRHFGVATQRGFSSFGILKEIRNIVANNQDIKVWNLSLGSIKEVKDNYISPEAAELDRIQSEYDVIFIVAGTNTPDGGFHPEMKVGAPADSLNSLVVNAVNFKGQEASYSRKGPVLSFFHKPDLAYYGGDGVGQEDNIAVCTGALGATYISGTSFAAPWITRKVAYLVYTMGMSREVAKALLIDSAAKWMPGGEISDVIGYGVVPKRIEDIVSTPDDEIKFILTGTAEDYETYSYNLPVPIVNGKHPFYARAVLAYFPFCDRNQGVDYTSTEMDIHFGRINIKKNKASIVSINDNKQTEEGEAIYEETARNIYRKWDNLKRICEEVKGRVVPRKAYEPGMWGIGIISKERTTSNDRNPMQFGVVITLKEMYGKNRISDFIKMCQARSWLVESLDVRNRVELYNKAEEIVKYKD